MKIIPGIQKIIAFTALGCILFASCGSDKSYEELNLTDGLYAILDTSAGEIVLSLEFEKTLLTVANFVGLAEGTLDHTRTGSDRFYDGLTFHRVVESFVIQGGCPNGNGTGDPGYKFADEFNPELLHDGPGVLSMANSGPASNGSQFFITLGPTPHLDYKHSVFGRVVKGMDVVESVNQGDTINKVTIIRQGEAASAFNADQQAFDTFQSQVPERNNAVFQAKRELDLEIINSRWTDTQTTESGILYSILTQGSGGDSPGGEDIVTMHITGMLPDGRLFYSTEGATPLESPLNGLVPGMIEGVSQMQRGEKRLLILPPELAYGMRGTPDGSIPPASFLIFEVTLIDFKPAG